MEQTATMETLAWLLVWGLAPTLSRVVQDSLKTKPNKTREVIPTRRIHGETVALEATMNNEQMKCMEDCMPGCQHGWMNSSYENAKLHYRKWVPGAAPPQAVVIFVHGISTHSGKAFIMKDGRKLSSALLSETLVKSNVALYALDLYGHGLSEGTRYWIPGSYETNETDLKNFCQLVARFHEGVPIFLAGESYGCTLSLLVAKHFQETNLIDSVILTAPAIIGDIPPSPVYELLIFLGGYFPKWRPFFMPNPISPDRIWRDESVRNEIKTGYHQHIDGSGIPFRLGTGVNLVRALEACRAMLHEFNVPFLILHGTKDYGVPIEGSELLWEKALSRHESSFYRLEGAYHDLLADPVAEECMEKITKWIERRLRK